MFLFNRKPKKKTFLNSLGMSITLTEEFTEQAGNGSIVQYVSSDVLIMVEQHPCITENDMRLTVDGFMDALIKVGSEQNKAFMRDPNFGPNCLFSAFHDPESGITFCYHAFIYKAANSFWMVQFVTRGMSSLFHKEDILQWEKTIKFKNR